MHEFVLIHTHTRTYMSMRVPCYNVECISYCGSWSEKLRPLTRTKTV